MNPKSLLSPGASVVLNPRTYSFEGGEVLLGGTPSRVVRLKPAAARVVRNGCRVEAENAVSRSVVDYLLAAGLADPEPDSLPERDTAEVTVVIPCYRRPTQLRRLLQSVVEELPGSSVIVVDDASGALSADIADAAAEYEAQLIALPENSGPADARNAGLAAVRTSFTLFVDSDVVLTPGSISLIMRHFDDPGLAAVAPRVLGLQRPRENWVLRYERFRSSLDHGPEPSLVKPHSPLSWLSTTCLLARTETLGAGFSRGMRVAEDVDLVWRLVAQGWRVRYEPRAKVNHEHRDTATGWLGRKYTYGTGAAALAQRHGDLVAPAVTSPWVGGVVLALAAQRRWSLPAAAGITVLATAVSMRKLKTAAPEFGTRCRVALRLSGYGLSSAAGQGLALTLRHWWPGVVAAALVSERMRRLLLAAAVIEAVWEYARVKPAMDPLRFAVARRLDDAAYGLGVWAGALRARSLKALQPICPGRRKGEDEA